MNIEMKERCWRVLRNPHRRNSPRSIRQYSHLTDYDRRWIKEEGRIIEMEIEIDKNAWKLLQKYKREA